MFNWSIIIVTPLASPPTWCTHMLNTYWCTLCLWGCEISLLCLLNLCCVYLLKQLADFREYCVVKPWNIFPTGKSAPCWDGVQKVHASDKHEKATVHSICIRCFMQLSPDILKIAVCISFVLCGGLWGWAHGWRRIKNRITAYALFIIQAQCWAWTEGCFINYFFKKKHISYILLYHMTATKHEGWRISCASSVFWTHSEMLSVGSTANLALLVFQPWITVALLGFKLAISG